MAFQVGFMAYMPLNEPGRIVLPPVCVPSAMGTWKSPTAAPEPDDEPPSVRDGSCGFDVFGPLYEGPTVVAANSVVVVLPTSCQFTFCADLWVNCGVAYRRSTPH